MAGLAKSAVLITAAFLSCTAAADSDAQHMASEDAHNMRRLAKGGPRATKKSEEAGWLRLKHDKRALARLGMPRPAFEDMEHCALTEARSQQWLDLMMLAPLRCMTGGQPGTFVELGAFTGVNLSNTVMLERCFQWSGLLIEGSPSNYAKLIQSGRKAPMVHSAVCPGDADTYVNFTSIGGEISGEPSLRTTGVSKNKQPRIRKALAEMAKAANVPVVCRSLERILDKAGHTKMDILFLDVEGAEAKVLSSINPSRFAVIIVEAPGFPDKDNGRHKNTVEPLLLNAGFRREVRLEASIFGTYNPVYVLQSGPMKEKCIRCAAIGEADKDGRGHQCREAYLGPNSGVPRRNDGEARKAWLAKKP